MDRPTLRQLEALDMIAREGSFRAGARAMGVSQVAVSDHVRQLEARLGISLFERTRGGKARLSAAGEAAVARARLILADCDALVTTMHGFASVLAKPGAEELAENVVSKEAQPATEPAAAPDLAPVTTDPARAQSDKPITIGTHPSILSRFQDKLAAFEDAFPSRPVSVDFNCFVADRIALALSAGLISIGYFYALGKARVFPSDYLWSERWALYVGSGHPLAGREVINREDLLGEALISFAPANRLRPLLQACLAEARLGTLPFAFESDDYGQLVERAREGAGILPLFGAAAARIGGSPGIRRLAYVDPIPPVEVRRVVHPSLAEDDEIAALIATLQ